ncbi:type II toxin-antitoxin system prevent-host-death family antitoxin [Sphingomonas sp. CROZ-RG-20F-R02-07]|uniref:type II toxin-antitoxin system Phd/YefM family antitoxin n=1 Tax=Sphingomonas sp. CROZ-RG-20F-R02-07 TaxID=2914832 RepID=UPI001F582D17|nr:type II toxin-antitoxin system prevent-host-death family antitoxin [Sphingomonas sp. CROZ-RG-20F-R02-07]
MIHVGYTDLRKRLAHYMDRANDDRDAILITRQGSEPVVMLAQRECDAMLETLYLRSSPANAERLDGAVAELDRGGGLAVVWDEQAQSYKRA